MPGARGPPGLVTPPRRDCHLAFAPSAPRPRSKALDPHDLQARRGSEAGQHPPPLCAPARAVAEMGAAPVHGQDGPILTDSGGFKCSLAGRQVSEDGFLSFVSMAPAAPARAGHRCRAECRHYRVLRRCAAPRSRAYNESRLTPRLGGPLPGDQTPSLASSGGIFAGQAGSARSWWP
jgi:hypothetical protein